MYELMPNEKKFVQIIEIKNNGFVEFNFAVGEAVMNVELLLPYKAFIEFCQKWQNHDRAIQHNRPISHNKNGTLSANHFARQSY